MQLTPFASFHKDLLDARLTLRQHLMNEFDTQLKRSRVTHYTLMNKLSRLMARKVAAVRHQLKIPFILSQTLPHKIHPQDIVDKLREFINNLYNLRDDPQLGIQPASDIESFLSSLSLPSLDKSQLQSLKSLITEAESGLYLTENPLVLMVTPTNT